MELYSKDFLFESVDRIKRRSVPLLVTRANVSAGANKLSVDCLRQMDAYYALSKSENSEIKFRWYLLPVVFDIFSVVFEIFCR